MADQHLPINELFAGAGGFKDPETIPVNRALNFINQFTDSTENRALKLEAMLFDIFSDEKYKNFISDLNIIENHIPPEQRDLIKELIALRTLIHNFTTTYEEKLKFENFRSLSAGIISGDDLELMIQVMKNVMDLCPDNHSRTYLGQTMVSIILCSEMIINDEDLRSAGKLIATHESLLIGALESIEKRINPEMTDVELFAARFSPLFNELTHVMIDERLSYAHKFSPTAKSFFQLYRNAKTPRNTPPVELWFSICLAELPVNFLDTLIKSLLFDEQSSEKSRRTLQSIAEAASFRKAFSFYGKFLDARLTPYKFFLQKLNDTYEKTHLSYHQNENKKFVDTIIDGIFSFERTQTTHKSNVKPHEYVDSLRCFIAYDQEYFLTKLCSIITEPSLTPEFIERLSTICQYANFTIDNFPSEKEKSSLIDAIDNRRKTTSEHDKPLDQALSDLREFICPPPFGHKPTEVTTPHSLFKGRF